jgi:hypothetical protein
MFSLIDAPSSLVRSIYSVLYSNRTLMVTSFISLIDNIRIEILLTQVERYGSYCLTWEVYSTNLNKGYLKCICAFIGDFF